MDWMTWVHGTTQSAPPGFGPGDEVRVWFKILEQGKERLGQFEGIVIRSRGAGVAKTFTVRRVTHGEGVERIFPLDAKTVSKIEVLRQGNVRRSRLYFLRTVIGKTRIEVEDATSALERNATVSPNVTPSPDAGGEETRTAVAPPPARVR